MSVLATCGKRQKFLVPIISSRQLLPSPVPRETGGDAYDLDEWVVSRETTDSDAE